jgi:hypothetical protein
MDWLRISLGLLAIISGLFFALGAVGLAMGESGARDGGSILPALAIGGVVVVGGVVALVSGIRAGER